MIPKTTSADVSILVAVWVGNQKVWVGNYESATKKALSRQPKRVWVNQKRWFGNYESATKKALSRQLRKRWVGNQKNAISATKNRSL